MEKIWNELYKKASEALGNIKISEYIEAGSVAAAIESQNGNIYVGVCLDTACSLGVCAERNAVFNIITNKEYKVKRILVLDSNNKLLIPCGVCREFFAQLMPNNYQDIEIMVDLEKEEAIRMGELLPNVWFK